MSGNGTLKCWICQGPHYASQCDNNRSHGNYNNNGRVSQNRDNKIRHNTDSINSISAVSKLGNIYCISSLDQLNSVDGNCAALSNHMLVKINGCSVRVLVDSGATCNVMSMNIAEQLGYSVRKIVKKARLPDNKVISNHGTVDVPLTLAEDLAPDIDDPKTW